MSLWSPDYRSVEVGSDDPLNLTARRSSVFLLAHGSYLNTLPELLRLNPGVGADEQVRFLWVWALFDDGGGGSSLPQSGPLRLSQRTDGRALSAHPRLPAGQARHAPRVGGKNVYP